MTTPDRPAATDPEVLARARAALTEAVAANQRQQDVVPDGPEGDAHRAARRALEAALERVDAGTYGHCTSCGRAVPPERLELVPEAEHCVACAQQPRALYG